MDLGDWDHTFDDRLFDVVRFSAYSTSDAILGHISDLDEIYRSSRSYMITPTCGMHTETRTCSLFYHGPSMEPPLSHPIKPVFFRHLYVIMLLIPGDISLMFGFDSDYGDRTFDG